MSGHYSPRQQRKPKRTDGLTINLPHGFIASIAPDVSADKAVAAFARVESLMLANRGASIGIGGPAVVRR